MQLCKLPRAGRGIGSALALSVLACIPEPATAQTYGIATMQPGTLNHTTGSAIAKVLKEKGSLNVLVQPTAGETTLIPMVGARRGRARHRQHRRGGQRHHGRLAPASSRTCA